MLQALLMDVGKIELKDTAEPEPGDDEILIKVKAALTCGTDLKAYLRGHSLIPMPGPFGHEYSGVVVKVGKNVRGFKEGDEIMGVHSAPCGNCGYCRRGFYNLCENIMDNKVLGAYAEELLIPSHVVKQNLFPKPGEIEFPVAAFLEPLSCVVHPYSQFDLSCIERALIIGAGPIGLLHSAYMELFGVETTVVDRLTNRLEVARTIASKVVLSDELEGLKESAGFDLVVECTGMPEVWEQAVSYLRRGGRLILFGGCPSASRVCYSAGRLHYDEITLMGSFHFSPEDVKRAYQLITEGKIRLNGLISGSFRLEEIARAFELLREGQGIKYAIIP